MTEKPSHSSATANTSSIEADVAAIGGMPMIDNLLRVICRTTGMGFAAVARVTEDSWIACAVYDEINFGLISGKGLEVKTTICDEIRQSGKPVIINDVDNDTTYCSHHTPAKYGFKSYVSVPIWLKNGQFFGTLCAIDTKPALINNPTTIDMFALFAELISNHLSASEAYNKLEQANAKLQQAVETGKMGTWSINPHTMTVTMSDYIKEIFGFPVEEEISIDTIVEAIDPQYRQALTDVLTNALEHHQSSDIEYPITNAGTGQRKWVRATGRLFYNSEGELTEYSGILVDITEQKEDDEKEAKLAAIIESSEDAIISKTLDGIITSWNQSAQKLFGFTEAEAVGKHISIIIPDDRAQEEYVIINKVRIGERIDHFETIRKTNTGL